MEYLIILVVLTALVVFVTTPLRGFGKPPAQATPAADVAELLAAREAKYREIRDAELDHRTGKLSEEDFRAVDGTLRAEAAEILRALDRTATIEHR